MKVSMYSPVSLILLFFLIVLSSNTLFAFETQNVFIVSVDGIRNQEAFDYEFQPGQSVHPYIPFIWNQLKPLGTSYLEFYNIMCTFTSPGHSSMLNGTWEVYPNHTTDDQYQSRPWSPTIFEYARKGLGIAKSKTWCVVGKSQVLETNWSIMPEYGEPYGANLIQYPLKTVLSGVDSMTVDKVMEVLDANSPSLLFVNLRFVDEAAHKGNWNSYIQAIRDADRAVQRIWNRIQTDPVYQGKTTLIVTTDHGRHDDAHGGFTGHGGMCQGCKHLMYLMTGPDTPQGLEVTRLAYQIDIAPTIGKLMGFSTPFSKGQVLREGINGYNLPARQIMMEPATDVFNGMIFVTWADNRTGIFEIYFKASYDGGNNWEDDIQISQSGVYAIQPSIGCDETGVHIVWLDYQAGIWEIYYKKSENFGFDWPQEQLMFSSIYEKPGVSSTILWEPYILTEKGAMLLTVSAHPMTIGSMYSFDGGNSWELKLIDTNCFYPRNINSCRLGTTAAVTWCDQAWDFSGKYNWEVFFKRSDPYLYGWLTWRQLSFNSGYSIYPNIDSDGSKNVCVAWADNNTGKLQINYRKSTNRGVSWNPIEILSSSSTGAWQPDIAWNRVNNDVRVLWSDYRDGHGESYYRKYSRNSWGGETRITNSNSSKYNPCYAIDEDGSAFLVWEEISPELCQINLGRCCP